MNEELKIKKAAAWESYAG